jgi:hypothetical protein
MPSAVANRPGIDLLSPRKARLFKRFLVFPSRQQGEDRFVKNKPDASFLSISLIWKLPVSVRLRGLTHPASIFVLLWPQVFSDRYHGSPVRRAPAERLKTKENRCGLLIL